MEDCKHDEALKQNPCKTKVSPKPQMPAVRQIRVCCGTAWPFTAPTESLSHQRRLQPLERSEHKLPVYLAIQLSMYLSILSELSVCRSVCCSMHLFAYLSTCLPVRLSIYLSVYRCIYLWIYLSSYLAIYLSIHLSICVCS